MHQLPENIFLLSLRQDRFINERRKFLGDILWFVYLKDIVFFTQIEQK